MIGNRRLMLIKSMRVGWAGHEAHMGAINNVYSALEVGSDVMKFFPILKAEESIILKL